MSKTLTIIIDDDVDSDVIEDCLETVNFYLETQSYVSGTYKRENNKITVMIQAISEEDNDQVEKIKKEPKISTDTE